MNHNDFFNDIEEISATEQIKNKSNQVLLYKETKKK